jgi:DNA-binding response OmpR family regulator
MLIPKNEGWQILLVDDDEEDYFLTRSMLRKAEGRKIELDWAPTYEEGQRMLQAKPYHAVLVDYSLGARTGIELIQEIVSSGYSPPMILLTGHGGYEVDVEAMQAGATLYLTKADTTPLLLERSIRYAIEQKRIEEELDRRYLERSDILESIKDGFIAVDRNWQITYINKRAANNGSAEPEQLAGQNIWEAFPQLPGTDFEVNSRQVMDGRTPIQFEMQGAYPEQWYGFSLYPTAEGSRSSAEYHRAEMDGDCLGKRRALPHLFDYSFEGSSCLS